MSLAADPDVVPSYPGLLRLDGRTVVVLGAGAGMGRQSVHALAQAGASVVCVDRELDLAAVVAEEVGGHAVGADVTDRAAMDRAFAEAAGHGPVTGVVDVVGMALMGAIDEFDDDRWDQQFAVCLRHVLLTVQIGGAAVANAGGGALVFVGSGSGDAYCPGQAVYGASKAAVHRLATSAGRELAPRGVRVNVVAPGLTRTPRLDAALPASAWTDYERRIPRGRAGTPAEIAGPILFLISELSAYVNGQVLTVDGGLGGSLPALGTAEP
ncbi:SDR family NAD(P)-dependent oxidoreductase [Actinomycetospora termitidis]|uniref:SDR family NAD(P)-dependent oxidoreductase n=1 Tax=Actinomycetospora termitidis TaxID=3053470 RepID=A0ABT7M658_9PSEU|nr:SDR family NAD(P)-dependent oxidoreductase [Actinomycetospora sp. Odt1-22]MDL5156139.1 SDR family NAD(P)-dependent oxidoreductase [Actinomycetospora sp. Odt1-22]